MYQCCVAPAHLITYPSSYLKVIYDLLVKTSGPLELREDADQGVQVRRREAGGRVDPEGADMALMHTSAEVTHVSHL